MKIAYLIISSALLNLTLPHWTQAQTIGFEGDSGYAANADIAKVPGWEASGSGIAKITDETSSGGNQSLEFLQSKTDQSVVRVLSVPKDGIIFIDFMIRPTADQQESPLYTISANGATLGFVKSAGQGTVVAIPGGNKTPVVTKYTFAVDENGLSDNWIRITIREDIKAKSWDCFLDGILQLIDQPLADPTAKDASFVAFASPAGDYFIDDWSATDANPLFADADKDDIPDDLEKAVGTNPLMSDRGTMLGGTSVTNINAFFAGTSFKLTQGEKASRVIYVDNNAGSDQDTGEVSYSAGRSGPKATISAALGQADDRTMIALLPSDKPYHLEDPRSEDGVINLLPLGQIVIEGNSK